MPRCSVEFIPSVGALCLSVYPRDLPSTGTGVQIPYLSENFVRLASTVPSSFVNVERRYTVNNSFSVQSFLAFFITLYLRLISPYLFTSQSAMISPMKGAANTRGEQHCAFISAAFLFL